MQQLFKGKRQPEQKSHFLPGAIGKTGVPAKFTLRGDSTAGLSYRNQRQG